MSLTRKQQPETVWTQLDDIERRLKALETTPRTQFFAMQEAVVATSETTNSASYVDLTTVGPTVTATVGPSGKVLVLVGANVSPNTTVSAYTSHIGFTLSSTSTNAGTTSLAAADTRAAAAGVGLSVIDNTVLAPVLLTGLAPSSSPNDTTFTLKYRADGINTAAFYNRFLLVLPL